MFKLVVYQRLRYQYSISKLVPNHTMYVFFKDLSLKYIHFQSIDINIEEIIKFVCRNTIFFLNGCVMWMIGSFNIKTRIRYYMMILIKHSITATWTTSSYLLKNPEKIWSINASFICGCNIWFYEMRQV